jgi:hypothetical protein
LARTRNPEIGAGYWIPGLRAKSAHPGMTRHAPDPALGVVCRLPWADEIPTVGSGSPRGPDLCRFDGQIVQSACMPKERFPRRVFSAEFFSQFGVI